MARQKRLAFTLIELLVVVTIIAVLVAILLPALQQARASGRAVVCASRLKQQGLGMMMYLEDNGGHCPPLRVPTGIPGNSFYIWADYLYPYLGGASWDDREVYRIYSCPELQPESDHRYQYMSFPTNVHMGHGFSMNLDGKVLASTLSFRGGFTFATTILIGDGNGWRDALHGYWLRYFHPSYGWTGLDDERHHGVANVLMADGHVENGSDEKYQDEIKYNWGFE